MVIGAGFIGSEIAAALAMQGRQVTMIFRDNSIGENVYPPEISKFLNTYYRKKGVELLAGDSVSSIEKKGERLTVHTAAGMSMK